MCLREGDRIPQSRNTLALFSMMQRTMVIQSQGYSTGTYKSEDVLTTNVCPQRTVHCSTPLEKIHSYGESPIEILRPLIPEVGTGRPSPDM